MLIYYAIIQIYCYFKKIILKDNNITKMFLECE